MQREFNFTKYYLDGTSPDRAVTELSERLAKRCAENGLRAVDHASKAHFVYMIIRGNDDWLHFDSKGHFLPLNTKKYEPVITSMSRWKDSVTCWVKPDHAYTLRRYHQGELRAKYANLEAGDRLGSPEAAEQWRPVYEDWQAVLPATADADKFYRSLPAALNVGTPAPFFSIPAAELPAKFEDLFGWKPELSEAAINLPVTDGPGYRSASGEYYDADTNTTTYIACYAHPEPGDNYASHWQK